MVHGSDHSHVNLRRALIRRRRDKKRGAAALDKGRHLCAAPSTQGRGGFQDPWLIWQHAANCLFDDPGTLESHAAGLGKSLSTLGTSRTASPAESPSPASSACGISAS